MASFGYIRRAGPLAGPPSRVSFVFPLEEWVVPAVSVDLDHIWSRVRVELAAAVDEPTYRIWLEPLRAREFADGCLRIEASPQACAWIRDRFGRLLQACATSVLGPDIAVELIDAQPGTSAEPMRPASPSHAAGRPSPSASGASRSRELVGNPKLTFDQFVIGDSNRLAHAAALTVAEMPGQAYNPLFICGPPGVGKTHLLHSIAGLLIGHNPGLSLLVATGESFTNEFQLALGDGQMGSFKRRFRHVDVLLIDDVQFLERKARTEEEFFHTFNSLYDAGAQIVLTSDRPPRDLQALEDRLRERFEAGLVADVRSPDLNTRLAILRKRAQQDEIEVADDSALETIAQRVTLNVRALEGALIRVVAFSSLTGRPLSNQLATEVLDGLYPHTKPRARSIADIQAAACQLFGLSPEELLSSNRAARVAWPRQMAMYLARELTGESLPSIGRHFGGRDHTTVLHAWRRTEEKISSDISSREAVEKLRRRLEESPADRPA
jgi:chromosomal replication initiator protein